MADIRGTDLGASSSWQDLRGTERYAACMAAARAGDRQALAALVEDLTPVVWHVARTQGLNRAEAEDVVQSVWLALFRHLDHLAEPYALISWLIGTARRTALHRRDRAGNPDALLAQLAAAVELVHPPLRTKVHNQQLWRAFVKLPQRCQELLRLTVLSGRADYAAVARTLRMPKGSVGPSRSRCLTGLRDLLAEERAAGQVTVVFPVTIYLGDGTAHEGVQAAVEELVEATGGEVVDRDDPVPGSWFRRMRARVTVAATSPAAKDAVAAAAHALDSRLVLAQDATVTAMMMQNLGPVLTSLQATKDAVIRVGALLIVKVDWTVAVHQLTAAQQLRLDHQPQLLTSPHDVVTALNADTNGRHVDGAAHPPAVLPDPAQDPS